MVATPLREFRPTFLFRLFNSKAAKSSLQFSRFFLTYRSNCRTDQISYLDISKISYQIFLFWRKVELESKSGNNISFGWVSSRSFSVILETLKSRTAQSAKFEASNSANSRWIHECNEWYMSATNGTRWVTYAEIDQIIEENQDRLSYLWETELSDLPRPRTDLGDHIIRMNAVKEDRSGFRERCNIEFERQELERYRAFFDRVLGSPLTLEQRKAVIVNEDATLVVAAAGSGKTAVIKSKVAYLIKKKLATPQEIQVISFNKNVQQDLEKSLASLYPGLNIDTFHALGLKILADIAGKKPSVTDLAESREKLGEFLDILIAKLFNGKYLELSEFFVSYAKPYRDKFDFKTVSDYISYVRSVGLVTFNGETVKSLEELEIANYLYANRVSYIYEQDYEHPVASVKRRQYKPDFYLPDYKIYIEHFAIDITGNTPPHVDRREYLASREWKISTHKQYKTKLVQSFSYEKRSGTLTRNLRENLALHGVAFLPLPKEQLLEKLNTSGYISELGILLGTFLNLFKGSSLTIEELSNRLPSDSVGAVRSKKFIEIFEQIYRQYQHHLNSTARIDFNDMIQLAERSLQGGHTLKTIKFLLIDEFQDISIGRARFIKALLLATGRAKLLAVGDDWQSIYRFSGSDISVMTSFGEHFGRFEERMLTETFRFNQWVERVSSRFVLQNAAQKKKEVSAKNNGKHKAVILWHPQNDAGSIIMSIAKQIPVKISEQTSILILARYNFYKDQLGISDLNLKRPDLTLTFSSVHAAKGAEADYVILVGVKCGRYSFPSEVADDPLLDLVLAQREQFLHAEERRLLYVALTRTKNAIYVVGDPGAESVFFSELAKDPDVEKSYLGTAFNRRCFVCKAPMVERYSRHGLFFGCSNFPICDATSHPCINCGRGFLLRNGVDFSCDNPSCSREYKGPPASELLSPQ
jgi:DNA helicase-4